MKAQLKNWLREPLLHFLLAGVVLFGLYDAFGPDTGEVDPNTIVVDRDALMTFTQFRARAFEPSIAAARLDAMSSEELELVIDDYVREEVLHREAVALGLEADDYVIKRRLITKLEFIARGFAEEMPTPSEDALLAWFEQHRQDYFIEPTVTFTHVFLDRERHLEDVDNAAEEMVQRLADDRAQFADAIRYGDRFPFHTNYVEQPFDLVASHFGEETASWIFSIPPDDGQWHGPIESEYGKHVVLVSAATEGLLPELSDVRDRVLADMSQALIRERTETAIAAIIDSYEVKIEPIQLQMEGSKDVSLIQ